MAKARLNLKLLAGCVLLLASAGPALAQRATPEQILAFRPIQNGVAITTPATPQDIAGCKVEVFRGSHPNSTGYMLYDSKKQLLRRFFDSNGDGSVDIWSYYKDGVEVYREVDSNFNKKADQFRWLGEAGMKWGVDFNEDGKIDSWKTISSEEVAHEAFLAVSTRDFARLQALFITDAELKAMKLPTAQDQQIRAAITNAQAKFGKVQTDLATLTAAAKFIRAESAVPSCIPADAAGTEQDLIKFPNRVVLFEGADTKHEFMHTGAMIQVGMAWRLIDAPSKGDVGPDIAPPTDKRLQDMIDKLAELDKRPPNIVGPGPNKAVHDFQLERAALVKMIIPLAAEKDREIWIRQLADNLGTAAQAAAETDKSALQELGQLRLQHEKATPGSNLTGYIAFRELWSEFAEKLTKATGAKKTQEQWMERLSKFVQTYPKADDTPDALIHLIMGCEFGGKEDEAKRWCQELAKNFADHPMAVKARGIERRLNLVGNKMELAAPILNGGPFNINDLQKKIVVVYYWESHVGACIGDFARMKEFQKNYGSKGLEIVTVNLDEKRDDALKFMSTNQLPAPHLFQAGGENQTGLNSPLATQYGIMGRPTIFLVGRDGNVISRSLQINDLEEAIRKAVQ